MLTSKISQHSYSKSLIEKTKKWLGKDGTRFFLKNWLKYGTVSPVFSNEGIPHAVHFREGMQVRNFLRKQEECEGWDSVKLDDNWIEIVEEAITNGEGKTLSA